MDASRPLPAPARAQPVAAGRLLFVDNIRVFLTVLVLLHHLMITYAHTGGWPYLEGTPDFVTKAFGAWLCSVDQAYFMGLFLLISAYFVPGSYDRKGPGRFLRDRLIRLGIPLAVFSWVISPLFVYALYPQNQRLPFFGFFPVEYFRNGPLLGAGPLWFVETLLIFSLVYVGWRLLAPARSPMQARSAAEAQFPSNIVIAAFVLLLAAASFLVRLVFAMDSYTFQPLNLQIPFFAQYIALFVVGLVAYRRNWLIGLPDAVGRRWLWAGGVLVLLWPVLAIALKAPQDDTPIKGGWHWQAAAYALWEAAMCVSACIGLVYAFRRYLNGRGRLAGLLVPNAYTAYVIHAPVIVAVALAFRYVALYPLLKWGVVALVAVPLCFALSILVRRLPYADHVL